MANSAHSMSTTTATGGNQFASLDLLDAEHIAVFRHALDNTLRTEAAETAYAEIIDGLPTIDSWCEFHSRLLTGHPIRDLNHSELCTGSLEKAKRLRTEFNIYLLSFPILLLQDFQNSGPGTNEYILSLIELLARSCHQIAVFLYQLDEGVHKHDLYTAWRDSPVDHLPQWQQRRQPCAFTHRSYTFYEQYPYGIADVAGYWAEAKIFGGVVVFNRGPSGTERLELYLHNGTHNGPSTLFPPTPEQFDSTVQYILSPISYTTSSITPARADVSCPFPIRASLRNGWRYHHADAISRFNIFRDRYERKESISRNNYRITGNDWPEIGYEMIYLNLRDVLRRGEPVEDEIAEAEAGMKRMTPSSPNWPNT